MEVFKLPGDSGQSGTEESLEGGQQGGLGPVNWVRTNTQPLRARKPKKGGGCGAQSYTATATAPKS